MPFEVFAGSYGGRSVTVGTVSIAATGLATFHVADLQAVGINGNATILIDSELRRIGLRQPRDDDGLRDPASRIRSTKSGGSAKIGLKGALLAIGVDPAHTLGRFSVDRKSDMLVVTFGIEDQKDNDVHSKRKGRKCSKA